MRLLKFTNPEGNPVWLVDTWIIRVMRSPHEGTHALHRTLTEITISGGVQYVKETPEEVVSIIGKGVP